MYDDLARDVARCRDGENVSKVCVLRPANVDWVVMLQEHLLVPGFLPPVGFSMQLPVAYETQPTIPTLLLVFVGNIFTPLVYNYIMHAIL